jgi:hypothetical protein
MGAEARHEVKGGGWPVCLVEIASAELRENGKVKKSLRRASRHQPLTFTHVQTNEHTLPPTPNTHTLRCHGGLHYFQAQLEIPIWTIPPGIVFGGIISASLIDVIISWTCSWKWTGKGRGLQNGSQVTQDLLPSTW